MKSKKEKKKVILPKLVLCKNAKDEYGLLERQYITSVSGSLSTDKTQAYQFDNVDSARNFAQAHSYLGRLNTRFVQ